MDQKRCAFHGHRAAKRRVLLLLPVLVHLVCIYILPIITGFKLNVAISLHSFPILSIEIDLKVAAKFFGTKFACGSSVTGEDEIVIQGDVKDDLFDVIPDKWPEIDEDYIDDLGDQKR